MTQDEIIRMARELATRHGSRMCDENGETHGEELYCVGVEDIAEIIKQVAAHVREACAKVCDDIGDSDNGYGCATAIRAIKFEGDTGFRPVSEIVAEHKQDPKKGAAIEKAKVRKATRAEKIAMSGVYEVPVEQAEQEPVVMDESWCLEPQPVNGLLSKEQAEQEPMYISKYCVKSGCACHYSTAVDGEPVAVYAAPVRTKDLTDEDIYWAIAGISDSTMAWEVARAVIEKFKEKNK